MLLITHLLLGLLVCHVLICSPPPTKAFTATGGIKKKLGALRQVTIKLVQPAAGNTQQQETNVIASIRGDGTLALAYAAGNLVQNMTLNPGQNPDRVACAILRYLRREEDDVADAATTSETSDHCHAGDTMMKTLCHSLQVRHSISGRTLRLLTR